MTNLTEQDLARIEAIEKDLKSLSSHYKEHFKLYHIAPVDTKEEVEKDYVEWVSKEKDFTIGKIYPAKLVFAQEEGNHYLIDDDNGCGCIAATSDVKPSTREAYLSQQGEQPNQIKDEVKERWKPIVTEWYWYIKSDWNVKKIQFWGEGVDDDFILAGNCFKTEEEAQSAATHIKKYLTTL